MKREPLASVGAIITGIMAVVAAGISFGLIDWSGQQVGAFEAMLIAVIPLVIGAGGIVLATRGRVTSMADPRMADGEPAQIVPRAHAAGEG